METKTEKLLRKNYVFFQSQLPSLLRDKNKKNKFAIIKDEQIVGALHLQTEISISF